MEIDLDYTFESLLLLTKKKYAGRKVIKEPFPSFKYKTEREVKGNNIDQQ
jgi:hypothetical protein